MPNPLTHARPLTCALIMVGVLHLASCDRNESPQALIAQGKADAAKKDHASAAIRFKQALQQEPQSHEARLLLGQALMQTGDFDGAIVALNQAREQNHAPDLTLPALARALLQSGAYKRIVTDFDSVRLGDKSAMADVKTTVALAWAALGDLAKARDSLAGALASAPNFGPALLLDIRLQAASGDVPGSLAKLDRLLESQGGLAEAWLLKGDISAADMRTTSASSAAYKKALEIKPDLALAHLALVSDQIAKGDTKGAAAQLEAMRAALPKSPHTLLAEGYLAFANKDDGRAREVALQLLRRFPEHLNVLHLAGLVESRSGSLLAAERHFVKVLQLSPALTASRYALAQVYIRLGQPQRALDALKPLLADGVGDAIAQAMAGDANQRLGDLGQAEKYFRSAAQLSPNNERFQAAIAMSRLARGESEGAFEQLESLTKKSSETVADLALISARLKRREFDAALRALDALERKAPGTASNAELRGRILMDKHDLPGARGSMEQALKLDGKYFAATAGLAAIDLLEQKPDQALKRLNDAFRSDPRNFLAAIAVAELSSKTGGSFDTVKAVLTEAIKNSPTEAAPRLQLIQLTLKRRQAKEAVLLAQDAVAALPNDVNVLDALARAQMEEGSVERAINTFRRIAGIAPNSALPYTRLADLYKSMGNKEAAETALRKALEIDPNLTAVQVSLIELMVRGKRFPEVIALAERMQRAQPRDTAGYSIEALAHSRMNAPEAALAAYRKGIAIKGASPDVGRYYYMALLEAKRVAEADRFAATWSQKHPEDPGFEYQLAITAITRAEFAAAEARLRKVVERQPDHPLALNNLAWVIATQNKKGGVSFAQRALDRSPDRPALLDTLAMALVAEGRLAEAMSAQKRAVELDSSNPGLRLNLAKLALKVGDKTLAKQELDGLRKQGPSMPFAKEVAELLGQI